MSSGNPDSLEFNPSAKPDKLAPRDEQWAYLQKAAAYVMDHPEGIAALGPAAMNIYTVVFEFCSNQKKAALHQRPQAPREPQVPATDQLYEHLVGFLDSYFASIYKGFETLEGVDLLVHYADQFDRTSASAKQLDRMFNFLNRQRVPLNPNPKHFGMYGTKIPTTWILTIQATVLDMWTSGILAGLQQDSAKFTEALIKVTHSVPQVKEEDAALVKKILESLIVLDDHLTNPIHQSTLHEDHFQSKLLSDWEIFCLSKKAEIALSIDGKAEAVSSVQLKDVLKLEMDRIARCLPERTQKELLARVETITDDKNKTL